MRVIAQIPWLLGVLVMTARASTAQKLFWPFAASAMLSGSQLLLGYPQYVLYSFVAEMILMLCLLGQRKRDWKAFRGSMGRCETAWVNARCVAGLANA